jgi:hypothetical protein
MTKDERKHYDRLSQLGCIACHVSGYGYSPAEIHHIKSGNASMGKKSHWSLAIPLCPQHHRAGGHGVAIHAGKLAFEANFGTEVELLDKTLNLIKG